MSQKQDSEKKQDEKLQVKHTFRDIQGNEVHLTEGGEFFTPDELRAKTDPDSYGKADKDK